MAGDARGGIVMVAYTRYPWDPRVRREAEALVRRGHAVTVICAREGDEPRTETIEGVSVERLPLTIRRGSRLRYAFQYSLFLFLAVEGLRRVGRTEAVHIHSLPDFLVFAAVGARVRRIPVTLDLHEALPEIVRARFPRSVFVARLALLAERMSCAFADRVIVVNETIRDLLVSRGLDRARVTVVVNSPDVEAGVVPPAGEPPIPAGARARLVYAGTVDRERDLETLVRAVGELRPTVPLALVIYGRGDPQYRSYLEGLVDGLGLRDVVHFGGVLPADRVLAHLAHADLGVVTYVRNPITEVALPNKVFEYVVLDKPLVLPDLPAMRRAFDGAALFYQPGNARDLAAQIRSALAGGAEVALRRGRARAVYEGARWDVQAERLAALYATPRARTFPPQGDGACT